MNTLAALITYKLLIYYLHNIDADSTIGPRMWPKCVRYFHISFTFSFASDTDFLLIILYYWCKIFMLSLSTYFNSTINLIISINKISHVRLNYFPDQFLYNDCSYCAAVIQMMIVNDLQHHKL